MVKQKEIKKMFIRAAQEGLWYEVIAISEGDNPNIDREAEVIARFEIGFDENAKRFKLKRIKFGNNTSREEWSIIMGYVREFINSLNE